MGVSKAEPTSEVAKRTSSPRSPMDLHSLSLMFTFDGEEGDELCLGLERCSAAPPEVSATQLCHQYTSVRELLGSPAAGVISDALEQDGAAHAKTAQLLAQWLSLPTTEAMLRLVFSSARRSLPISRLAVERPSQRTSLPVAPSHHRTRWSVSGSTPRLPPMATPSGSVPKLRRRRKSEPNLPTISFDTPVGGRPSNARLSFEDPASTPRRASQSSLRSPGSLSHDHQLGRAASLVHSPLSYFGTQPDVSSRFLQVPQGDGGVQAFFDDAAGGSGLSLTPEALLKLTVERLGLPRAVACLVVKRAQRKQVELTRQERQRGGGGGGAKTPTGASAHKPRPGSLLRLPNMDEREPGSSPRSDPNDGLWRGGPNPGGGDGTQVELTEPTRG